MGVRRDSIIDGARMALWTAATDERVASGRAPRTVRTSVVGKEQRICERAAADLVELVESMNGRGIDKIQEDLTIQASSPYRFGWDLAAAALAGSPEVLGVSVPKFRIRFSDKGDELQWSGEVQPAGVGHPYRNPKDKGPKDYEVRPRSAYEGKESHSFEKVPHTKTVAEVRQLLARRTEKCSAGCKGWDVFETDRGLELEVCDECNEIQPPAVRLTDMDIEQLPEAQRALEAAAKDEPLPSVGDPCGGCDACDDCGLPMCIHSDGDCGYAREWVAARAQENPVLGEGDELGAGDIVTVMEPGQARWYGEIVSVFDFDPSDVQYDIRPKGQRSLRRVSAAHVRAGAPRPPGVPNGRRR